MELSRPRASAPPTRIRVSVDTTATADALSMRNPPSLGQMALRAEATNRFSTTLGRHGTELARAIAGRRRGAGERRGAARSLRASARLARQVAARARGAAPGRGVRPGRRRVVGAPRGGADLRR